MWSQVWGVILLKKGKGVFDGGKAITLQEWTEKQVGN